jgi:hypothetical protein
MRFKISLLGTKLAPCRDCKKAKETAAKMQSHIPIFHEAPVFIGSGFFPFGVVVP